MKKKNIAVLLAAVMTMTAVSAGGQVVFAEEFVSEEEAAGFTDEEIPVDSEADTSGTFADEETVEMADTDISEEQVGEVGSGESYRSSDFEFEKNDDGTLTIVKYLGNDENLVIPESYEGMKITSIGDFSVFYNKNLKSVSMPYIEKVGYYSFGENKELTSVYMPKVKLISMEAFTECSSLTEVDMPEVESIGVRAFCGCTSLASVSCPNLKVLKLSAFDGCKSLTEFKDTQKLESISKMVFVSSGVTSVKLYGNVEIGEGFACRKNGEEWVADPAFTIYGEKGTTVEAYAKKYGVRFLPINSAGEGQSCEHEWGEIIEKHPTCTETGLSYTGCVLCHEKNGTETVIPAKGHDLEEVENKVEATCEKDGYTGDGECSRCGEEIKGTIIPAKGHQTELKNQKEASCTEDGYTGDKVCSVCGKTVEKGSVIPAAGHKYGEYKVTKAATIFEAGTETRECTVCKTQESREIPKLSSSITLSVKTLPLQVKKSVSATSLVTGMAAGDSIASLKTNNAKVAAVNNSNFKITGKKAGKATITITLKSGASANLTVTVKKGKVAATKITGIQKSITLKKGKKLTLKPVLSPITCTEKVTYSSSNKKVATVSVKGVIKASKKGKATIKVKAGKKTVTCKVTVK